jgi:phosphoglycolate phosphatase
MNKKLVLFDIDDTLIKRAGRISIGMDRWRGAMKEVYDIDIDPNHNVKYDGMVDYLIGKDMALAYGVSLEVYDGSFELLGEAQRKQTEIQEKKEKILYIPIEDTISLAKLLKQKEGIFLSIMTGNLEKPGNWKLKIAGIDGLIGVRLFSDGFKSRDSMAKSVFEFAYVKFGIIFSPQEITVIGDSIHDVRCGKAIGANTIGYTAGRVDGRENLTREGADLVVESLMDKTVMAYFNLKI